VKIKKIVIKPTSEHVIFLTGVGSVPLHTHFQVTTVISAIMPYSQVIYSWLALKSEKYLIRAGPNPLRFYLQLELATAELTRLFSYPRNVKENQRILALKLWHFGNSKFCSHGQLWNLYIFNQSWLSQQCLKN